MFCFLHLLVFLYLSFLLHFGRDVRCTGHSWQNLNFCNKNSKQPPMLAVVTYIELSRLIRRSATSSRVVVQIMAR